MQCAQRMARCGEGTFPLRKQPPGARNAALSGPLWGGRCFPRPRAAPQFSCRWSFLSACHSGLCSQLDRKILTLPETARFARACPVRPPAQRPPPLPPRGGRAPGSKKSENPKSQKRYSTENMDFQMHSAPFIGFEIFRFSPFLGPGGSARAAP